MKSFPTVNQNHRRTAAGIGVSLLLHALLLLLFRVDAPKPPESTGSQSSLPLVVELNRQPLGKKTVPAPAAAPPPAQRAAPPAPARPRPDRPMVKRQAPQRPPAPPRAVAPPRPLDNKLAPVTPAAPAPPADMSEMVAAARARRGAPPSDDATGEPDKPPQGDEVARANVARSVAQARGRNGAGGVFQITSKGAREASFLFRGWDNDSRAGLREMIQVDAGPNGNVEDAVVRKMIEIIRKYQPGDFNWNSRRLGHVVTLSARRQDSAGLEDFLKKEFF